jgi:hypothetical protein
MNFLPGPRHDRSRHIPAVQQMTAHDASGLSTGAVSAHATHGDDPPGWDTPTMSASTPRRLIRLPRRCGRIPMPGW